MSSCYKCGTLNDLSIKRTLKSGNVLYTCRPCRNQAARDYHRKARNRTDLKQRFDIIGWDMLAREINDRIALKYVK
jgi:hypothetical protein